MEVSASKFLKENCKASCFSRIAACTMNFCDATDEHFPDMKLKAVTFFLPKLKKEKTSFVFKNNWTLFRCVLDFRASRKLLEIPQLISLQQIFPLLTVQLIKNVLKSLPGFICGICNSSTEFRSTFHYINVVFI